jgi:uncharacterized protein
MTYVENDPDDIASNDSGNTHFQEVLGKRYGRRSVLTGGVAAAAVGFLAGPGAVTALASNPRTPGGAKNQSKGKPGTLLGFTPVAANELDTITVPDGYSWQVLIPWGEPLRSTGPAFKADGSNTAAEVAEQIGMHHDGMHFFPLTPGPAGNRRGLLVVNHEYTDQIIQFSVEELAAQERDAAGNPTKMPKPHVDKALAAHGVSVVEVAEVDGVWQRVDSHYNRRVTGETEMAFSGPAALDGRILKALRGSPVRGTLNNCSHGVTPWGTYLACEENWNGYFGATGTFTPDAEQRRYGVNAGGFGYRWHLEDERFDLSTEMGRDNLSLFGWCVEVDPFDPGSTPVKRTALGRFKHEGATFTESNGHVVVYSGDDQDGDYMYKFVSARPWRSMRARGQSPLDEGTLYVARYDDDGTGEWLPLVHGRPGLTVADGFADQADVLLRTRMAADAVGATKMDRPEWVAVHPRTGEVYLTLTNGRAGEGAANPKAPNGQNVYGHILRWAEQRGDHRATRFRWDIFLLGGDPAYPQSNAAADAALAVDESNVFGSPDGIWIDDDGRVWVQTDISNSAVNRADRGYDNIANNQMLVADPATGDLRRFLVGPKGAEITGVITTPDRRTMFINVQHPGEVTAAIASRAEVVADPQAVSSWPDHRADGRPRSATVVIRKDDGGVIGT